MTTEQVQLIAEAAGKAAAKEIMDNLGECPYSKDCPCDTAEHKLQHEWLKSVIQFMSRVETIKWDVLKAVVQVLVIAGVLGALAYFGIKIDTHKG